MRIVATSDTHNCIPHVPDGDLFIHCGDLSSHGTKDEVHWAFHWIEMLPHRNKIVVAGNHDRYLEQSGTCFDREWSVDGLKLYTSPWTPLFQNWAFMKPDEDLAPIWDKIPDNLDILITHGPPYGILDKTFRINDHVGSKTLLAAVKQKKPRLHIFGHIHEAFGVERHDGTTFMNVAYVGVTGDGKPKAPNGPVVIDWPLK